MVIENIRFGLNNKNCSIEIRIVKKKTCIKDLIKQKVNIYAVFNNYKQIYLFWVAFQFEINIGLRSKIL